MSSYDSDLSRRYWTEMLAKPGALVIDGNLYFVGPEPESADLAANPKRYGCYGTGFTIGHDDGRQTITHNLSSCGAIPDDLRPADNAAFIGEPQPTPPALPPAHHHFEHLDYIGDVAYPYECVICYRRFAAGEVPADAAETVFEGFTAGGLA